MNIDETLFAKWKDKYLPGDFTLIPAFAKEFGYHAPTLPTITNVFNTGRASEKIRKTITAFYEGGREAYIKVRDEREAKEAREKFTN